MYCTFRLTHIKRETEYSLVRIDCLIIVTEQLKLTFMFKRPINLIEIQYILMIFRSFK